MNPHRIDVMVTHLLQCSCNGAIESAKCDDTALVTKTPLLKRPILTCFDIPDSWNSILRKILLSKCSTVITIPRPLDTSTWREISNRKVLAPLPLLNCDNVLPSCFDNMPVVTRKRPIVYDELSVLPKRAKFESSKQCTIPLKRKSVRSMYIEYKCLNTKSSVKLLDVFKEIPQTKQEEKPVEQADFMAGLKLLAPDATVQPQREIKTSHPVKLVNYHQIPFSSNYGRHLLLKDRHFVSEDVVLRKLERTEWYLNAQSQFRQRRLPFNIEITFDKRVKRCHRFTFPKRQMSQTRQNLKVGFLSSICRPLCVEVERMDLVAVMKAQQEKNEAVRVKQETISPPMDEIIPKEEFVYDGGNNNFADQINFLGICSEHVISRRSDTVCSIVKQESIDESVLLCTCGEQIVLTSPLLECPSKPVGRKKKVTNGLILRRSFRLASNAIKIELED